MRLNLQRTIHWIRPREWLSGERVYQILVDCFEYPVSSTHHVRQPRETITSRL